MPVVRPFNGDGYLFPPPPKHNDQIYCLVVEKKGDETKSSMRQSEIYAYSDQIIIRDGYMVMPKFSWKSFEPGDWFTCHREFSVDRYGQQKEERELVDIRRINRTEYAKLNIIPTRFHQGNVQICCPFVLCPDFIRNKNMRNGYGSYRKLYLLNMGQGFVHHRLEHEIRRLRPGWVYYGVFEFRAKDNGAVNFGYRSEVRDQTGHVLERDAMWELMSLKNTPGVPVSEHTDMRRDLDDLLTWAQKFEDELHARGVYGKTFSKVEKDISLMPPFPQSKKTPVVKTSIGTAEKPTRTTGHPRADQLVRELNQRQHAQKTSRSPEASDSDTFTKPDAIEQQKSEIRRNDTLIETRRDDEMVSVSNIFSRDEQRESAGPVEMLIINREQLEAHRERVIMLASFHDPKTNTLIKKWIDRETNERSTTKDILNYKFDVRYGLYDDPPFAIAIALQQEHGRQRTFSDTSLVHNITVRTPLASSTPIGSPETSRRRLPPSNTTGNMTGSIGGRGIANQLHSIGQNDDTDVTGTLAAMRVDNNANPTRRSTNSQ